MPKPIIDPMQCLGRLFSEGMTTSGNISKVRLCLMERTEASNAKPLETPT